MDDRMIRQSVDRISARPIRLGIAVCAIVVVAILWTVRQSRLTHDALARAAAAEQAAAGARAVLEQVRLELQNEEGAPTDSALRRSRHDDQKQIERVKKLYEEIDGLSRAREWTEDAFHRTRRIPTEELPPANAARP
jgi:hypothetical protein